VSTELIGQERGEDQQRHGLTGYKNWTSIGFKNNLFEQLKIEKCGNHIRKNPSFYLPYDYVVTKYDGT